MMEQKLFPVRSRRFSLIMATEAGGFTLIEVLVALVVLAVGLLGLAALQVMSLKYNQTTYNRNQATVIAYDLADRMRANASVTGNYLTTTLAETAATCKSGSTPCTQCIDPTNRCSPTQLAVKDLYEWNGLLVSQLPNGTGSVTQSGAVYTITVNWDDNRDGAIDNLDPTFAMSFQ